MIKNIEAASNKSFKKYLWILAVLSLILLSAVYFSNFGIFKNFSKGIIFNKEKQQENNSAYVAETKPESNIDSLTLKEIEPIIENLYLQPKDAASENFNNVAEIKTDNLNIEPIDHVNSKQYLAYLRNVNRMIINFLLDKSYTNYLNQVKIFPDMPKTFVTLLENLEEYNDHYLIHPPIYREQVFPKNSNILQKFIRVDKNSVVLDLKLEQRNKIIKKLKSWVDYCYTEDFKAKFNRKN